MVIWFGSQWCERTHQIVVILYRQVDNDTHIHTQILEHIVLAVILLFFFFLSFFFFYFSHLVVVRALSVNIYFLFILSQVVQKSFFFHIVFIIKKCAILGCFDGQIACIERIFDQNRLQTRIDTHTFRFHFQIHYTLFLSLAVSTTKKMLSLSLSLFK